MNRSLAILSITTFVFLGCDGPSTETADSQVASNSKPLDAPALEPTPATSDSDDSEGDNNTTQWLTVPKDISLEKANDYIVVRDMAAEEDPHSLANLGFVSQQFAFYVAENGQRDDAYKFLKQAGATLRAALKGGVQEIPEEVLGQTFYFEAVALGMEGNVEASISSLDDAFNNGFAEIEILQDEEGLEKVRASNGYEKKLSEWELVAIRKQLSGGEKFPFELSGTSVAGNAVDLASLKGKVVIVDIWGTWCPPCRAEIPSFIKLQEQYGQQGFQMVGVNYENGDTEEAQAKLVTDYIAENGINYPCMLGDSAVKQQVPNFRGYPTTLFIDKSGTVRHMAVGMHPYRHLELIVTELLNEDGSKDDGDSSK